MNWNAQVETTLKCHNVLAIEVPLIERLNAIATLYTLGLTWSLPTYLWNLTIAGIDRIESIHPLSLQEFTQFQGNSLSRVIQALSFIRDYPEPGLFILENLQALINSQVTSLLEQEELNAWIIDTLYSLSLTQDKYLVLLDINEIGLPQVLTSIIPTISLPLPDAQ
ncbi:MAG TPA: hypothetical protein DD379_15735 [Cyanobacteria bacterium UBA11162]|nr:hypothetical protein [Cyanobacteria bacterium UBA11162]